ncbi:rho guanine nucleotide exchange factor 11-like isoform X4 [Gigantopelta aegis]|uniref:rho guanine nucleotide exchange factor 11-like isoform X4 n=1 Tax=Gigantopelta aegis TaxID=1735272 RepID=UPI001B88DDF6|nr:rho guanine nucleotide exchange factor 11-like isoform X4 [Gigantopelta aegis]
MPLGKKWRSLDLFGSYENLFLHSDHKKHRHSHLFRPRLSSLSAKEDAVSSKKGDEPPEGSQIKLVQRCVIIQKDEKGYGLTVSGDNPVFVQSVKQDGAAARAGVLQNDRIIKVNGTLVTNRNHIDVVKLIKSGSYVALTLVGKPHPSLGSTPSIKQASFRDTSGGRVTAPQPVDPEKDRELWQQKIHTVQAMLEQAREDTEKMQRTYVKNPSEKLHAQLIEKEKTVKILENQLRSATGCQFEPTTPGQSLRPDSIISDFDPMEHPTSPSWYQQTEGMRRHIKQASVPVALYKTGESRETRSSQVSRSKSDVTTRRQAAFSMHHHVSYSSQGREFRQEAAGSIIKKIKRAVSLPTTVSDAGSMSDSPTTSPSVSPTPTHPNNMRDIDEGSSKVDSGIEDGVTSVPQQIISMEDEDFNSEEEQLEGKLWTTRPVSPLLSKLQTLESSDPGPFVDITTLEKKPAHLSIFLHYLISNSDPSSLFFYMVSDVYSHAQGSVKDLRKWAYEIYSTFLAANAPLKVESVEDKMLDTLVITLQSSSETMLRSMFDHARQAVKVEIQDLLLDFRNKKDLGLGNIYGAHELQEDMDRAKEQKAIEKYLVPHLDRFSKENIKSDRDQAMGWALVTFLKQVGMTKAVPMERVQSFVMKDKKGLKFLPGKSGKGKTHKGHQLTSQHYSSVTFCNQCRGLIWGVGYQGFQCQLCEINIHKQCVDDLVEMCSGKHKKGDRKSRSGSGLALPLPGRKQSNPNKDAGISALVVQEVINDVCDSKAEISIQTQPFKSPDEQSELAGLPAGHSVKHIIERYEVDRPSDKQTSDKPADTPQTSKDLGRSESMKGRGEKSDRPTRRAKSDVEMDDNTVKALNQSGSSSTSSLSNRSLESPNALQETMNEITADSDFEVDTELPPLKKVLGDDVMKKLKPKEKKRQEVLNELFYTERAHVRNLKILDRLFHRLMLSEGGVTSDLAKALFPNLDQMISFHCSMNNEMKKRRQESPCVDQVGDILLRRFDGEAGEEFRQGCAEFCRNQTFALEALKKQQRKDQRLSQFLNEAAMNPLCRRFELKDLIPTQMQRLTKYPLLIDQLLKYTQSSSEEYQHLERAQKKSKAILAYVNQAVKECENYHRLKDMQKRLDKRSIENSNDPHVEELKKLDLLQHKLVHDDHLMWRLRPNRLMDVHVLLFEDILVLLQKQDDKLILGQINLSPRVDRDTKDRDAKDTKDKYSYTHSPVLQIRNLLARNVAVDKKAFFVVNTSAIGPQIYEFVAESQDQRKKWLKHINDLVDEQKKQHLKSPSNSNMQPTPQQEEITLIRQTLTREHSNQKYDSPSAEARAEPSSRPAGLVAINNPEVADVYQVADTTHHLIQPDEVDISNTVTTVAESVCTPIEKLRRNDERLKTILEERETILREMRNHGYTEKSTDSQGVTGEICDVDDRDERQLVVSAMEQNNQLMSRINCHYNSLTPPSPHMSAQLASPKGEQQKASIPIPMDQLRDMATRMNQILTNLLAAVNSKEDERGHLREELREAQAKLNKLRELQRAAMGIMPTPQSRPASFVSVASSISETTEEEEAGGAMGAEGNETVDDMVSKISEEARNMMSDAEMLRPGVDEMSDTEVQNLMSNESNETIVRETTLITNSPFVESVTDLDVDTKDTEVLKAQEEGGGGETEKEREKDVEKSVEEVLREVDRVEKTMKLEAENESDKETQDVENAERELHAKMSDSDDDNYHDVTDGIEITTDDNRVNNNDLEKPGNCATVVEEAEFFGGGEEEPSSVSQVAMETESSSETLTSDPPVAADYGGGVVDDNNDGVQGSMTTDLDEGGASDLDLDPDVSVIPNSLESGETDLDAVTKPEQLTLMDVGKVGQEKSEKCDSESTADTADERQAKPTGPIEI